VAVQEIEPLMTERGEAFVGFANDGEVLEAGGGEVVVGRPAVDVVWTVGGASPAEAIFEDGLAILLGEFAPTVRGGGHGDAGV
jgi:2-keto-4-pentenoate hydratase